MTDRPVLYSFRRCPYAMRARMALAVSGTVCRLREVALKNKPPELIAASPKGTVPVLVTAEGRVIDESLAIMDWALLRHDPEGWLDGRAEDLIAWNDGPFKQALDRYKYPSRYDPADPAADREDGLSFLIKLNNILEINPYLSGNNRSFSDIAIFPFIRQFAETDRAWFDSRPLPALQAWLSGHLESVLFLSVMTKHTPWQADEPEPLTPVSIL